MMNNDNKDLKASGFEEELRAAVEPVPESLRPDSIEAKLAQMSGEELTRRENSIDIPNEYTMPPSAAPAGEGTSAGKSNKEKKKAPKFIYPLLFAAALLLAFGVGFSINLGRKRNMWDDNKLTTETITTEDSGNASRVSTGKDKDKDKDKDDDDGFSIFGKKDKNKNYSLAYTRFEDYKDYMDNMDDYVIYEEAEDADYAAEATEAAASNSSKDEMATLTGGASDGGASGDVSFTDTNVRTEGVAEGDIIKTDGHYIYVYDSTTEHLEIYSVEDGKIEKIGRQNILNDGDYFYEMYIYSDYIVLLGGNYVDSYDHSTTISIYDISDRTDPELVETRVQSGDYHSSRLVDGVLYTFSSKMFDYTKLKKKDYETYIPTVDGELIEDADVFVQDDIMSISFSVITSLDIDKKEFIDKKAVLAGTDCLYVSSDNIYMVDRSWDWSSFYYTDNSRIVRISYDAGEMEIETKGEFPGYLNDDYSIDEYNGNIRLVTTYRNDDYSMVNGLYIYDLDMNKVSVIKELAENEMIKSARFMGETAYFVTFRNTDPLFAVDLSDPENPEIMDYLKIPGFSAYLHPYGEDKLLGIGYDTDENEYVTSIKLSMFDVSDPYNIEEVDKIVLPEFEEASVLMNRNAFMFDPQDGTFGFSVYGDREYLLDKDGWYYEYYGEEIEEWAKDLDMDLINKNCYLVFDYDEDEGFEKLLTHKLSDDATDYYSGYYSGMDRTRGIVIGDYLYIVTAGGKISSFDTKSYDLVDECY